MSLSAACNFTASASSVSATGTLYAAAGTLCTLALVDSTNVYHGDVSIDCDLIPEAGQRFRLNPHGWSAKFQLPPIDTVLDITVTVSDVNGSTAQSQFNLVVVKDGQLAVTTFGADPTGSVDSSGAFQAAVNALAGTGVALYVPAGAYKLLAQVVLPSSVRLIFAPGATIQGTSAGNSIFFATTTSSGASTTLAANIAPGATTISATASIPQGTRFTIKRGTGALYVFKSSAAPTGTGPYTITLDRPIWWPFQSGDTVQPISAYPHDITIEMHSGALMSGACANLVEVDGGQDVAVIGKGRFDTSLGAPTGAMVLFFGCLRARASDLVIDGAQTTPGGVRFFSCDQSHGVHLNISNVTGAACPLDDCTECGHEDCEVYACGSGLYHGTNQGYGSIACYTKGGKAIGCSSDGISIKDSCVNSRVTCVESRYNGTNVNISTSGAAGHPAGTVLTAIDASNATTTGLNIDSGSKRTVIAGINLSDCGATAATIADGCDLSGVVSQKTGSGYAGSISLGTGGEVRIRGLEGQANAAFLIVGSGVTCKLSQANITASGGNYGIDVTGKLHIDRTTITQAASGATGVNTNSGATVRIGPGYDARNCTNAFYLAAGAYCNRGQVTANGATGVTVTWPDICADSGTNASGDRVILTPISAAGAYSPQVAVTDKSGFTVTSTAGDTRTYAYCIE